MLNKILKNYQLFIIHKNNVSGIERFYPVISLKNKMQEDIELDLFRFKVVAAKSVKKGINIIFNEELHKLKYGEMLVINTKYGDLSFRIINDWTFNTNFNFNKFFYYSIMIHLILVGALAFPKLLNASNTPHEENKKVEKRIAEMIEKIESKNPKPKTEKIEKPQKEVKKIVVQKKEKKKGFWPSKKTSKKRTVKTTKRNRRRVTAKTTTNTGSGPVTNKKIAKSLDFLGGGSSKKIAVNTGSSKTKGKASGVTGFGSKGIAVRGISSDSSALKGGGNYAGAIETKGVRGVKSAKYKGGNTGTGYRKSLNAIEGKVSARTLGSSNKGGKIGGSLSRAGGLRLTGKGRIDQKKIQKAINKKLYRLTYCYEKALLRKPNLSGIIKIQWTIKKNRKVRRVKIVSSQMKDNKLHKCLIKEIKKIRFPAPRGGDATVIYPFKFKPTL